LSSGVPQEPPKKTQEHGHDEILREEHEGQAAPVCDRRDHVAAEPLARAGNDRGLPPRAPAPSSLVVTSEPHLVTPMNLGPFGLRPGGDGRVLLVEPGGHGHGIPLVGPAHGLLRGQTPAPQVPARGPDGDRQPEIPGQKLHDGLARPESEGQVELVRAGPCDLPNRSRRISSRQRRALRPSTRSRPKRLHATLSDALHPAIHRNAGDPEDSGRLRLRHPSPNRFHHPNPKRLLRLARQKPRISFGHVAS